MNSDPDQRIACFCGREYRMPLIKKEHSWRTMIIDWYYFSVE